MNIIAKASVESLPSIIDRASQALLSARSSAEILDAMDLARVAYDASKAAGRMARAKTAHDDVIAAVYRAQADALLIEARAKMRLADEYDAAQARGEVSRGGGRPDCVEDHNAVPATAADLGIRRDEIHEARQLRDAENAEPGLAERAVKAMLDRGEEPSKAAFRRGMAAPKPQRTMDPQALWLWGRLKDFDRDGVLRRDPTDLFDAMTAPMQADVRRFAPLVRAFLSELETL